MKPIICKPVFTDTDDNTKIIEKPNNSFEYDTNPLYGLAHLGFEYRHIQMIIPANEHTVFNVGDYCLFYNSVSKVLEVNLPYLKISSVSRLSESDAKLVNPIKIKKGENPLKVGTFTEMVHSFSACSLHKIVSSTDEKLGLPILPHKFVENHIGRIKTKKDVGYEWVFTHNWFEFILSESIDKGVVSFEMLDPKDLIVGEKYMAVNMETHEEFKGFFTGIIKGCVVLSDTFDNNACMAKQYSVDNFAFIKLDKS